MNVGPNLLHLVLLVCAASCGVLTLREVRHRPRTFWRLAAPALIAGASALMFLFLKVGTGHPPWAFFAALAAGLAAGYVRGFTLRLQVDHMFAIARLPRTFGSFLVSLVLVGAVLLEIGGAFAGAAGVPFRLVAPDIAAACAGVLAGRMIAIAMRWRREPHVDLRRM